MSSRLQLDVRNLSLRRSHLVNAYEVKQVWCNLQVKLCDSCLSALSVRYYNKGATQVLLPTYLPTYKVPTTTEPSYLCSAPSQHSFLLFCHFECRERMSKIGPHLPKLLSNIK